MRTIKSDRLLLALLILLGGCSSMPSGPSVLVLPGTGKGFEQFRADEALCRQYAFQQLGGTEAAAVATDSATRSAVLGTVLGAAAGAAMGGHEGAGVGAGTGLLVGSLAGSETAAASGYEAQRRYDHSYIQCMYMHGHRVPVTGRFTEEQIRRPAAATLRPAIPPPPSGTPPPPPLDIPAP